MTPEERAVELLNGPLAPRFEGLKATVQWTTAIAVAAAAIRAAADEQRQLDAALVDGWRHKKGGYTELARQIREGAPPARAETTAEAVLNACRAAYKKGLIEAAQDVCPECRDSRPLPRAKDGHFHPDDPRSPRACRAAAVIGRLEFAGGWQARWPEWRLPAAPQGKR